MFFIQDEKRPSLIINQKDKRKEHTAKIFNKFKHLLQLNIPCFFWDKKTFHQDQMVNSQNNYWFALSPQNVPIVMKIKHPVHIMVLGVVTSNSNIMSPLIVPHGLRLNMDAHINCLEEVVLPWIKRVTAGKKSLAMTLEPENKVFTIRKFLHSHHPNIWLPNSSDSNPFDYYMWGKAEQETNKTVQHQRWTEDKDTLFKKQGYDTFFKTNRPSKRLAEDSDVA